MLRACVSSSEIVLQQHLLLVFFFFLFCVILHFFFCRWRIFPLDLFVKIWRYGKNINGWWFRRISVEVFIFDSRVFFSFSRFFSVVGRLHVHRDSAIVFASIVIATGFWNVVFLPHRSFAFTHEGEQMWQHQPFYTQTHTSRVRNVNRWRKNAARCRPAPVRHK